MYTQLYFHPVRRSYDIHLRDFLKQWLPEGYFSTEVDQHLQLTDNEVTAALLEAARNKDHSGHDPARRIVNREHFRLLYQRNPDDILKNPEACKAVYDAACAEYGEAAVRYDTYRQKGKSQDFPVLARDGRIISSWALSDTLKNVPVAAIDYVFISPEYKEKAEEWLKKNLKTIITPKKEEES